MSILNMILLNLSIVAVTAGLIRWVWVENDRKRLKNAFKDLNEIIKEKIKMVASEESNKRTPNFKSSRRTGTIMYDLATNTVTLSGHKEEYDEEFLNHLLEYHEIPLSAKKIFTGK